MSRDRTGEPGKKICNVALKTSAVANLNMKKITNLYAFLFFLSQYEDIKVWCEKSQIS